MDCDESFGDLLASLPPCFGFGGGPQNPAVSPDEYGTVWDATPGSDSDDSVWRMDGLLANFAVAMHSAAYLQPQPLGPFQALLHGDGSSAAPAALPDYSDSLCQYGDVAAAPAPGLVPAASLGQLSVLLVFEPGGGDTVTGSTQCMAPDGALMFVTVACTVHRGGGVARNMPRRTRVRFSVCGFPDRFGTADVVFADGVQPGPTSVVATPAVSCGFAQQTVHLGTAVLPVEGPREPVVAPCPAAFSPASPTPRASKPAVQWHAGLNAVLAAAFGFASPEDAKHFTANALFCDKLLGMVRNNTPGSAADKPNSTLTLNDVSGLLTKTAHVQVAQTKLKMTAMSVQSGALDAHGALEALFAGQVDTNLRAALLSRLRNAADAVNLASVRSPAGMKCKDYMGRLEKWKSC